MKHLFYGLVILILASCSPENSWDCTKSAGKMKQQDFLVDPFQRILIWDRVKLFIQQGPEQKVIVETGENLMDNIEVSVTDGKLEIRDNTTCNYVRDYGITKVYVTSPNIIEIRSSSGYLTESIGTLHYPQLTLLSDDYDSGAGYHTDGDFKLDLDVDNLNVVANGLSKFYLSGNATKATFGLYAGDCRIYSEDLNVHELQVYHRSSGPMVVNPQQSIKGKIVSVGDIISKNRPPIVEVEELYRGRLIFE